MESHEGYFSTNGPHVAQIYRVDPLKSIQVTWALKEQRILFESSILSAVELSKITIEAPVARMCHCFQNQLQKTILEWYWELIYQPGWTLVLLYNLFSSQSVKSHKQCAWRFRGHLLYQTYSAAQFYAAVGLWQMIPMSMGGLAGKDQSFLYCKWCLCFNFLLHKML